jgi:myo-inositol-1(or 4)-monophosphatase
MKWSNEVQAEVDFAADFALGAGQYMKDARENAIARQKLDKTAVTDADDEINRLFIEAVKARYGDSASVTGEEMSAHVAYSRMLWVIDPIDGTDEYIDTKLAESDRSSCVGIALFVDGVLQLSAVFNPFRSELFVATNHSDAYLNDEKLYVQGNVFGYELTAGMSYDYSYWKNCPVDVRFLEQQIGVPCGTYSAISQACDVARGDSAFAIFPGDTIHDIAPGALLVMQAGGVVSDTYSRELRWDDLSSGVIYAVNPQIQANVVALLNANR